MNRKRMQEGCNNNDENLLFSHTFFIYILLQITHDKKGIPSDAHRGRGILGGGMFEYKKNMNGHGKEKERRR